MQSRRVVVISLAMLAPMFAACRGTGRLAEYDFRGRTLAMAYDAPPNPAVLTGPYFLRDWDNPARLLARLGGVIAREVEASRVRPRLDSAVARVDVSGRLAQRTLDRAALHLRALPAESTGDSDFVIEVIVREYGIDAEDWHAAAHFFIDADLFLIGGRDGVQIWRTHIRERDRITPAIFGSPTARDVVTAVTFASLSVDEIARALERLADFSADRITGRLRDALEKVQRAR